MGGALSTFRLLALDIDGTLLGSDRALKPRTRDALKKAQALGVKIVLVTGRRFPSAQRVAALIGSPPLAVHNGALIVEDGSILRCLPLPREVARRAIQIGREYGADAAIHCGHRGEGRLVVEGGGAPSNTLLAYYLDRSHPDVETVPDLADALIDDPLQVMFGGPIAEMEALVPPLQRELADQSRIERTVYPARDVALLDILHPAVSKAEAVAFLRDRWGFAESETMAIGDNWNDREMLEEAGLGLVMGNAEPAFKALGFPELPTNDHDGVAVALERFIFGRGGEEKGG